MRPEQRAACYTHCILREAILRGVHKVQQQNTASSHEFQTDTEAFGVLRLNQGVSEKLSK